MDDLDDLDGPDRIQRSQWALEDDFAIISAYGDEYPEVWAGAWWDNEPTVRMVAAFTGDVAQHEAALRPRLRHPDRLVVESRQHSVADLRRLREEIERSLKERAAQTGRPLLASIGYRKAVISIGLRADQEDLASELAARYGSAVELRVGNFTFPDRRPRRPRSTPGRVQEEEQTIEGLEMSVEVDQAVLEVGDDGRGRLVLRNTSSGRIGPLDHGQPLVGSLLNASLERVGGYSGAIAGTGRTLDLAPGESASVWFIYGTASSRPDLGYALPPGRYWLKVRMDVQQSRGGPANLLTVPLTPITIIPRARPHGG